ncbi:MAG TPA: GGDEF domain-containing protein [Thermotogota bacterium]|nr:GGDEF domain-containing protein [Thermotogota bacterium]HPJ88219.1 GGDEF domain-containing protein [Thermotogota bacterium]
MIDVVNLIDVNFFSMIVLIIIFFSVNEYKMDTSGAKESFKRMILSVLFMLVCDTVVWSVDGIPGNLYRVINSISNILLIGFTHLTPAFWLMYTCYQTIPGFKPKKRHYLMLFLPVFVSFLLCLFSPFTGWVFSISPENVYSRREGIDLLFVIAVVYVVTGTILILNSRTRYHNKHILSLFSFIVAPLVALTIQSFYYGTALIWNSLTVSILIIYLNLQRKHMNLDYLTGLNNRIMFDNYLIRRINGTGRRFTLVMIDIDNFKMINDGYGHKAGDRVLMAFADILSYAVRKDDFVSRYGGDEFVIILDCEEEREITEVINRIKGEVSEFNAHSVEDFKLDFSYGYKVYDRENSGDYDRFMHEVDMMMYADKRSRR